MKIRINNIYCTIIVGGKDLLVDQDLFNSLRYYMSVAVPGAFFTSQYKKRVWDGRKYFITPGGKMATGFLPLLLKHIDEEYPNLPVEIIDERERLPLFKTKFISKIGLIEIDEEYEHQMRMIKAFDNEIAFRELRISFPRGIMNAATNAGKTAAIAGIYLNLEGEQALLVLIHRKTVFTQLVKFFEEIDPNIGQITANVYNIQRITIAMIKTVYNRLQKSINVKKDLSRFSVVAVDECHLSGSKTYSKVLQNIDAPVRIFVSGTPFDSDAIIHKMIAIGLSGPEVIKITKRELMDKGVSLEVNVHVHLCNTLPFNKINTYDDYIRELINNSTERVLIMADIIKENIGKSTLIAVEEIDHGNKILRGLKTCFAYDSKVRGEYDPTIAFVHGEDPDREQKIKDFSNGKIKILISTRILKEGVNIPIIGNLIYAVGGKAKVDIKQWMGRMERKHEDDKIVTMHDFYDIGKYVENHSIKRIRTYKNEDLTVIEHYKREDIRKIKKAKTLES